jgi:hypothetical protein
MDRDESRSRYRKVPGVCKYTLRRNVRDYIDYDYLEKLSFEELQFLHKFTEEFYCGKVKKGDKKAFHKTNRKRKECYNRNNAINRDAFAIAKCSGRLFNVDSLKSKKDTEEN